MGVCVYTVLIGLVMPLARLTNVIHEYFMSRVKGRFTNVIHEYFYVSCQISYVLTNVIEINKRSVPNSRFLFLLLSARPQY